jgi:hypothetical protein
MRSKLGSLFLLVPLGACAERHAVDDESMAELGDTAESGSGTETGTDTDSETETDSDGVCG